MARSFDSRTGLFDKAIRPRPGVIHGGVESADPLAGVNFEDLAPGQFAAMGTDPNSAVPFGDFASNIPGMSEASTVDINASEIRPPASPEGFNLPRPTATATPTPSAAQIAFRGGRDVGLGSSQARAERQSEREAAIQAPILKAQREAAAAEEHKKAIELKEAGPKATAAGALERARVDWTNKNAEAKADRIQETVQNQKDREASLEETELNNLTKENIALGNNQAAVDAQEQKFKLQLKEKEAEGLVPGTPQYNRKMADEMGVWAEKLNKEGASDAATAAYKRALELATKETVVTDVDGKDKTVTTTEESTGTPPKPALVTPDSVSAKPGQVEDVNKDGVVNQEDITLRDTEMEQLQKGLLANVNPTTGEPLSPEQIKRAQDRIAVLRKIKFAGE